jgi:hypothetical protein
VGLEYAGTVVIAISARSAVVQESASTDVNVIGAKSVRSSECIINQITVATS